MRKLTLSGKYIIKITSVNGIAFAFSEEFEVIPPIPIKIIEPNSESIWHQNKTYTVKWQALGPESNVYIDLLKMQDNGQWLSRAKIADGIENVGEYTLTVPNNLEDGNYRLGIRIPPIKEVKHSETFTIKKNKD